MAPAATQWQEEEKEEEEEGVPEPMSCFVLFWRNPVWQRLHVKSYILAMALDRAEVSVGFLWSTDRVEEEEVE